MAGYALIKYSSVLLLGKDIEVIYRETWDRMDEEQHPRIVENFFKNGYRTKRPELQEIEREYIMHQKEIETKAFLGVRDCFNSIDLAFNMAKSTQLMNMSIDDVIDKIERAKNCKINSFPELLDYMSTLSNEEAVMAETMSSSSKTSEGSNAGTSVDEGSAGSFKTPPPKSTNKAILISKVGSNAKRTLPCIFPSPSEMLNKKTENQQFATPSGVFQFGRMVQPSTNKPPRHLKPNELAFSVSGSPLYVPKPKVNPVLNRNNERFVINDNDGRKIVDVVLIQGEEEKTKEYKSVVTDIRGIVATRSTVKKTRVLPPKIPTRGAAASASSAKKTPNQKPIWKCGTNTN